MLPGHRKFSPLHVSLDDRLQFDPVMFAIETDNRFADVGSNDRADEDVGRPAPIVVEPCVTNCSRQRVVAARCRKYL